MSEMTSGLVERAAEALDWAIAEIEGRTYYTPNNYYEAKEQRENAMTEAQETLAALRARAPLPAHPAKDTI